MTALIITGFLVAILSLIILGATFLAGNHLPPPPPMPITP